MARLIPCPSCARHVRALERDCPFCGHAELTTSAPNRLCVLLLGLGLAACTSPASPSDAKPNEPAHAKPEPATKVEEPQPDPEPTPPSETTGADETTGSETTGSEGTDDGASTQVVEPPPNKPMYGGPRPDPRPAKKYGGPPAPDPMPIP